MRKLRWSLALLAAAIVIGVPLARAYDRTTRQRNFREVDAGLLYRSGQMTPAGLERALKEFCIGTVISFRDHRDVGKPPPDEYEDELCRDCGVHYHRLSPLRWSSTDGTVPAEANVKKFLALIKDPRTPKPILVHCFAGVHRTGAFVALYRIERNAWSSAEAVEEMLRIGGTRKVFDEDQIDYLERYESRSR